MYESPQSSASWWFLKALRSSSMMAPISTDSVFPSFWLILEADPSGGVADQCSDGVDRVPQKRAVYRNGNGVFICN